MKREEEINQVSKSYASQMCDLCLDEYCKEMGLVCPQFKEYMAAYSKGVKWADEHPQNMWHSADEQPVGEDWKILLEDKNGRHWVTSRCSVSVFYGNWQKFTEDDALTRWAYISDLLPKGGKK